MFSYKSVVSAITLATMIGSSAFAASADGALAPGKPAGIEKAQLNIGTGTLIVGLGAAAIIATVAIVVSNQSGGNATAGTNFAAPTTTNSP